jgi:hypothetical protein
MTTRIKLRRDTAANWLAANPILAAGEPGLETDTGKVKYGDGETAYALLPHAGGDTLTDDGSVVVRTGSTAHWIATQRRNGGDTTPRALRYDSQGNLYALTRTYDIDDEYPIAVITKYTAAGAIAWQKTFSEASPRALAIDSSDCAYITVQPDGPEVNVIKFSTAGAELWKKSYDVNFPSDNAYMEEKSATTLVLVSSIYIGGSEGSNAVLVMEISSTDGSVQIKKQIAFADEDQFVTTTGVDVDGDENVFVTGHYNDPVPTSKGKMFIEKLDENLNRVWSKSLETDSTYSMDGGDCASDAQGNIFVVGSYSIDTVNFNGTTDQIAGILTKLNSSGVVQWTRRIGPGPCSSFIVGLTATDTGDVYLSAATFVKKTDGDVADGAEEDQIIYGQEKLIVARVDTQGAVIWQRYVDVRNFRESWTDEIRRAQSLAVYNDKFAIDGYGETFSTTPQEFADSSDNEDDYFVVQLPTDGTELTIGGLDFTESRVPSRFITHTTSDNPLVNSTYTETVLVETSSVTADAAARVANSMVKSETYDYVFGADGTLTIPNDGDIRLTQSQVGYLIAIGGNDNQDFDVTSRAVAVDSEGNAYVGGEEDDNTRPFVTKISPEGVRQWSVSIGDDDEGDSGSVENIAIDPTTGAIVVLCDIYDNYQYGAVITLEQDTGRILNSETFRDSTADVYLNDVAWSSTGTRVLAGSKNGEFVSNISVTPQTGSTTGTIVILRSAVSETEASTNWQIGGTGIDPFENITSVERYTGLTGATRQGSGATFDIIDNGNGSYSAAVVNGGTNYLAGHKIKILGTSLGGATPDNDITITVQTVDGSGVIQGGGVGNTGTAAGAGPESTTYTALAGTNTDVGSGVILTFDGPRFSNLYRDYWNFNITNGGSNYVENDIIVIPGTSLGGTSPNNDLTWSAAVGGGAVNSFYGSLQGVSQTSTWKLATTTQVDFASTGSWAITYPLSRESLLITPTWTRTFGTDYDNTDRLYAVTVDSEDNIIAVGEGQGNITENNSDDLAIVYKFNQAGTLLWTRKLNETSNDDCSARSVVTIGTDIYVTHDNDDDNETIITKLDASGNVKWQRITGTTNDYISTIARTADGNLLVATEANNDDTNEDAIKVFLLSPSGEVIYQRWLQATTDSRTSLPQGRSLVVSGDSFYITGYFYANDFDSTMVAKLPVDGSGTGDYGAFRYQDVNYLSDNFNSDPTVDSDVNYSINPINLQNSYAGPLYAGEEVYINTATTVTVSTGSFFINSFYPTLTVETVSDTDGGNIVFADGSKQSTSATDIPQRRYHGDKYTLSLEDRGHHIYCRNDNDSILIPYNSRVEFPIGTVITVVNNTNSTIRIEKEGGPEGLIVAGNGESYGDVNVAGYGMVTLLKVEREVWFVSGNLD